MLSHLSQKCELRLAVALLLALLVGFAVSRATAFDDEGGGKRKGKDRNVHELMERTHEGRRSPLRQLETLAAADKPSWDELSKILPRFDSMSKALINSKNKDVHDAADGYVDAVKDLNAAATKQDAAGLKAALKSLKNSCSDCHSKGGPGGKLDDD